MFEQVANAFALGRHRHATSALLQIQAAHRCRYRPTFDLSLEHCIIRNTHCFHDFYGHRDWERVCGGRLSSVKSTDSELSIENWIEPDERVIVGALGS